MHIILLSVLCSQGIKTNNGMDYLCHPTKTHLQNRSIKQFPYRQFILIYRISYNRRSKKQKVRMKYQYFLCLFLQYLLQFVPGSCKIESLTQMYPFSQPLTVWDIAGSHMVILTDQTAIPQMEIYDFVSGVASLLSTTAYVGAKFVSTHPANTGGSYCIILQIGSLALSRISVNSTCGPNATFTFLGEILSRGFGIAPGEYYATYFDTILNQSQQKWYRCNGTLINTAYNSGGFKIISQLYHNQNVFFVAEQSVDRNQKQLSTYHVAGYPTYYNTFSYRNCPTMSLDAYMEYLIVDCSTWIDIRSTIPPYNLNKIINLTINSTSSSSFSTIVDDTVLVLRKDNTLWQYSILTGEVLDWVNVGITEVVGMKRVATGLMYIFSYEQGLLANTSVLANFMPYGSPWGFNGTNTSGTNGSALTNSTTNTFSIPSPTPSASMEPQPFSQQFNESIRNGSNALGNLLSILSLRMTMQSNIPLALFMEEFWLYRYYVGFNYSQYMGLFMQEMEIINLLKFQPSFMQFLQPNFSIGAAGVYKNVYTTSAVSYSPTYYGESVKESCTINFGTNILLYLLVRLCLYFYQKPKVQSFCLRKIVYAGLRERGHWWSLVIGLLEADFLVLCFYSLNQLALPYCFVFENKLNLAASVVGFLFLIFYGTVAYSMLYASYRGKTSNLLVFSKTKSLRSYCLESSSMLAVKLIKSFAHSALLSTPTNKFLLLSICDFSLILAILFLRNSFFNKAHFYFYLLYQLGVGTINVLLILRSLGLLPLAENAYNNCTGVILVILLIITFLKMVLILYKGIRQQCASSSQNRVVNYPKRQSLQPIQLHGLQTNSYSPALSQKKNNSNTTINTSPNPNKQLIIPKTGYIVRIKTMLAGAKVPNNKHVPSRFAGKVKITRFENNQQCDE